MARPRIFVSSTYYDLKHIRSSLELFIESLGFEPVLSEKGDIPYTPDQALDESCYREAASADLFVLVIGGRYGSEVSGADAQTQKMFYEQYESITRKEFDTAYEENVPVFVLIETGVFSEYHTYLKNRSNTTINYAHVDSVNVFKFIESILSKQRNNPVFQFERSAQIEAWLREQWAGLFRELLRTRSQQKQLLALTNQVSNLETINETLKTYLEAVLTRVTPETSEKVIQDEEKRLGEVKRLDKVRKNRWFEYLMESCDLSDQAAYRSIIEPVNFAKALTLLRRLERGKSEEWTRPSETLREIPEAQKDFNFARKALDLPPIDFSDTVVPKSRARRKQGRKSTMSSSELVSSSFSNDKTA